MIRYIIRRMDNDKYFCGSQKNFSKNIFLDDKNWTNNLAAAELWENNPEKIVENFKDLKIAIYKISVDKEKI